MGKSYWLGVRIGEEWRQCGGLLTPGISGLSFLTA